MAPTCVEHSQGPFTAGSQGRRRSGLPRGLMPALDQPWHRPAMRCACGGQTSEKIPPLFGYGVGRHSIPPASWQAPRPTATRYPGGARTQKSSSPNTASEFCVSRVDLVGFARTIHTLYPSTPPVLGMRFRLIRRLDTCLDI